MRKAILGATTAAQREMDKLDARGIKALETIYRDAASAIGDRIRAYAGADGNVALQELQSVLAQVNARLLELSRLRDEVLDDGLTQASRLGVRPFTLSSLPANEVVVSTAAGIAIADEALNFARHFVAEDGLQLSDRTWRLDRGAREAVSRAIEQAIIQGHGAAQATNEFLARGAQVSSELRDKINSANADGIARKTSEALLSADGNQRAAAMRVFRTEINRAHGLAYIGGAKQSPHTVGFRYKLSPAHPRPDVCNLYSTQNLFGLGPGVYPPDKITEYWPAHPNILSYVAAVFDDEITVSDRSGRETAIEALDRLTPEQRVGVLGVAKAAFFAQGKLTTSMIRAPLKSIRGRVARLKPRARSSF